MKATLEFNMPEEQPEFTNAINGGAYARDLEYIGRCIRNRIKHVVLEDGEREFLEELYKEIPTEARS